MATWQQVKSYIYNNYTVATDDGDRIGLNFQLNGGRSQMVILVNLDADEFSSLIMMSPVASWSQVSADRVLRATEQVPVAIRSTGDLIVASHTQLLATIDEPEIDLSLQLLVSMADNLEKALGLGNQY